MPRRIEHHFNVNLLDTRQPRTSSSGWGRLIFHVTDVDEAWAHLKARGLDAQRPQDASWGERYFHLQDPDGNELSFAKLLR
jgi:uncharacterized glyoxalase superfamily protein PhnB